LPFCLVGKGCGMCGCDLVFAPGTAERVRATLREHMGGCPCERGGKCPFLPDTVEDVADLLRCKFAEERAPVLVGGPCHDTEELDTPREAANRSLGLRLRLIAEEARQSESA
jgi:hypothetical protein